MPTINQRIRAIKKHAERAEMESEMAKEELTDLRAEAQKLRAEFRVTNQAMRVLHECQRDMRQAVRHRIESIVNQGLQYVFREEAYTLQCAFSISENGTAKTELVLCRHGIEIGNAMDSVGGGVLDVISFCLRVAAITLHQPAYRRLIVMDEPFRFLSAEYRPRIAALLEHLRDEYQFQFVMVTHFPEFELGQVVDLR